MNSMAWIGIIIWGMIVAAFGLLSAHSPLVNDAAQCVIWDEILVG